MYTSESADGTRRSLLITPSRYVSANRHGFLPAYALALLKRLASSGELHEPKQVSFFSCSLELGGIDFYFVSLDGTEYVFRWSIFADKQKYGLEDGGRVNERDASLQKMLSLYSARGDELEPLVASITKAQDATLAVLIPGKSNWLSNSKASKVMKHVCQWPSVQYRARELTRSFEIGTIEDKKHAWRTLLIDTFKANVS